MKIELEWKKGYGTYEKLRTPNHRSLGDVFFHRNVWHAYIGDNDISLGQFENIESAKKAVENYYGATE